MSGAHTPKRGKKAPSKPNPPLRYAGDDSRHLSHTKRGPGRRHNQGKGHKYVPREVERSAFHPEVIAERRALIEAAERSAS